MDVTGPQLRQAREAAHVSLTKIAEVAGVTPGHLSRMERQQGGRAATPSLVHAYEKVLGVSVEDLPATPVAAKCAPEFAATQMPADGLTVEDMQRRHMLMLGLFGSAALGAVMEPARLLQGVPAPPLPRLVGNPEVSAVERNFEALTDLDLRFGGGLAAQQAHTTLRWATELLGQKIPDDAVRDRLQVAVAAIADRTGWANYDIGNYEAAQHLFALGLNTASTSSDRDLRAHIMLNISTELYDLGYRREAVEMIFTALGDDRVKTWERANLHTVVARHFGGLAGERDSARRHLDLAQEALAQADPREDDRPWTRRVTAQAGHFDSALGLAFFANGEDEQAMRHFTRALAVLPPGRQRTASRCLTRLSVLNMRAGNHTQAEELGYQVLDASRDITSVRIRNDLAMLETAARQHQLVDLANQIAASVGSASA